MSIAILCLILSNHLIFGLLSIICIVSFIVQFFIDKKDVRDALYYARVPVPFWKRLIDFRSLVLLPLGFHWLSDWLEIPATKSVGIIYLMICTIVLFFESEHAKFIHSIRAYSGGLKITGRTNIIPWNDVQRMAKNENQLTILLKTEHENFTIDKRDLIEVDHILRIWQESNPFKAI